MAVYRMACTPRSGYGPVGAAAWKDHGLVGLCPEFWNYEAFPDVETCPAVSGGRGHRYFIDNGEELASTQFAVLIHELVHLYNTRDMGALRGEVYYAQDCVNLDAQQSLENANNWAFYAACEFQIYYFRMRREFTLIFIFGLQKLIGI